jgi:hypothetical protein
MCPAWNIVESSNVFVCKRSECESVSIPIHADELFDEFCTVKAYVESKLTEWRQKDIPC